MKDVSFKVLETDSLPYLQQLIEEHLLEGYELAGNLQVVCIPNVGIHYFQPVVRTIQDLSSFLDTRGKHEPK